MISESVWHCCKNGRLSPLFHLSTRASPDIRMLHHLRRSSNFGSDVAVCHCDKSGRSLWLVFKVFVPSGRRQQVSPKRRESSAKIYDVTSKQYVILTSVDCPLVNWQLSNANYNALAPYLSQFVCFVKENGMNWNREDLRQTVIVCVCKSRIWYKKKESGCGRNLKNKNLYGTPLRVCVGVARVPITWTARLTASRPDGSPYFSLWVPAHSKAIEGLLCTASDPNPLLIYSIWKDWLARSNVLLFIARCWVNEPQRMYQRPTFGEMQVQQYDICVLYLFQKDEMFYWNNCPVRSLENFVLPSGLYLLYTHMFSRSQNYTTKLVFF
jgi:hypothetical protein